MRATDAGVAALAAKDSALKALTTLNLTFTGVGDTGAAALFAKDSALNALTELNLRGTRVTDATVAAIRKALPNCRIVHRFA